MLTRHEGDDGGHNFDRGLIGWDTVDRATQLFQLAIDIDHQMSDVPPEEVETHLREEVDLESLRIAFEGVFCAAPDRLKDYFKRHPHGSFTNIVRYLRDNYTIEQGGRHTIEGFNQWTGLTV